jgi:hypothetical protein
VHYVAERKEGFLWSSLAKSSDGLTVVNIEAIQEAGNVGEFFSDTVSPKSSSGWTRSPAANSMPIRPRISCSRSAKRPGEHNDRVERNAPGRQKSGGGTFPLPALTTLAPPVCHNLYESASGALQSRLAHVPTATTRKLPKP